jgi:hypothetical protein
MFTHHHHHQTNPRGSEGGTELLSSFLKPVTIQMKRTEIPKILAALQKE